MKPNYRRCITCRRIAPKEELWRVVRVFPSREVQLDEGMGRSAYLCPQTSCLEGACRKNRLAKTLKSAVPEEIYRRLEVRLEQESKLQ